MPIQVKYQDNTKKIFNVFQEINDYDNIIQLNCNNMNLTELPNITKEFTSIILL
jgi:hypothetical protein